MSDLFNETDVADLEYTKRLRKNALQSLVADGPLPDARKNRIFIDLLDGMDRQILSKASIKTQDETNKSNASLAAQLLLSMQKDSAEQPKRDNVPTKTKVVEATDVPGELEIGETELSLDKIMSS